MTDTYVSIHGAWHTGAELEAVAEPIRKMGHSLPWHPRLSEKLGLFRLVEGAGSHEVCFTNPALLALKIVEAGRD